MGLFGLFGKSQATSTTVSPSFDVLGSEMVTVDGTLDHFTFEVEEWEGGQRYRLYRVVTLRMLRYLPQEARQQTGLIDKMEAALSGLYNQRIGHYDLVELKIGLFQGQELGIVQLYGAAGIGQAEEPARKNARLGMAAVQGVLSNFPQSRLEPLDVKMAKRVHFALKQYPYALVVIGQPEPRDESRGMGREGPGEVGQSLGRVEQINAQQGEMVCRAMADQKEDFAMVTLSNRVAPHDVTRMLTGMAQETSVPASQQSGSETVTANLAVPFSMQTQLARNVGTAYGRQRGRGVSEGVATSRTHGRTEGRATTYGRAVTNGVARTEGYATSRGTSTSESISVSEGEAQTRGTAHTEGTAHTKGTAHTVGESHTQGRATTHGHSTSHSSSTTQMPEIRSVSVSAGRSQSQGQSWGTSQSTSHGSSSGWSQGMSQGQASTQSTQRSLNMTQGTSSSQTSGESRGVNASLGFNESVGVNAEVRPQAAGTQVGSLGADARIGASQSLGASRGVSSSETSGQSSSMSIGTGSSSASTQSSSTSQGISGSVSQSATVGASQGESVGHSQSSGISVSTTPAHTIQSSSVSHGTSHAVTQSESHTVSEAFTTSESVTQSSADTTSQSNTTSQSSGRSVSRGSFQSVTRSVANTVSHAETESWASTRSVTTSETHGQSVNRGVSRTAGESVGRTLGQSMARGLGVGLMPSFGLSRGYQWWNDQAVQLTQIMRAQEELLRRATLDGAYQTDVYVLTRSKEGAAVAETALRQAYHGDGELVVTPVQTRRLGTGEQEYIRKHAMAFMQSTREESVGGALETYRDSTTLLPRQLAAYTAPVLFEEGPMVTMQERIPAFAFLPDMKTVLGGGDTADAVLAHQWSTERAELTEVPLVLSKERFFHTVFGADTGFGKSVAAERLVYETTRKWHYRTVVLDFGAGWRRLLQTPELSQERVEVYQLFPGALVPFRWNPWQVGKRVQPERQMVATCEIFKNAGRMGARQLGLMRRAARELYLEHGVLTADKEVYTDGVWGKVRDAKEEAAINAARAERGLSRKSRTDVPIVKLEPIERQALAVHRSKAVDMSAWVERLASYMPMLEDKNDRATIQSLEGILLRLEPFTQGEMARMYGSGEDTVAVEDLALLGPSNDQWGVSILEGGAEMDEYAKISILGLVAWHLYNDAVVRRRRSIGQSHSVLQIVFEEANKVLTGTNAGSDDDQSGAASTSALFQSMWRDGRKYRIFLHPIVQTVSELPPGILSSCNNAFFSQTKNPDDRDLMMAHLAFSEKGFTDEDYKRFISRMPVAMAIAKLGYTTDIMQTTPFLCRPLMVPAEEPTDDELYRIMHERKDSDGTQSVVDW